MWKENEETIQTWQTWGIEGDVILKKIDREFAYRPANKLGDWLNGLPEDLVWADVNWLFKDSF